MTWGPIFKSPTKWLKNLHPIFQSNFSAYDGKHLWVVSEWLLYKVTQVWFLWGELNRGYNNDNNNNNNNSNINDNDRLALF